MAQFKTARAARLEARISPDLKRRLEYAASLRGATLTEFVVQSAQEAAERTIASTRTTRNGVPLLPVRPGSARVTSALVRQLQNQLDT